AGGTQAFQMLPGLASQFLAGRLGCIWHEVSSYNAYVVILSGNLSPMAKTLQRPNMITLGLVQMRCELDPDANLDKAEERIRQAARSGARVVCLQELFRSPYFCQRQDPSLFDLAEPIPGPSTHRLG